MGNGNISNEGNRVFGRDRFNLETFLCASVPLWLIAQKYSPIHYYPFTITYYLFPITYSPEIRESSGQGKDK